MKKLLQPLLIKEVHQERRDDCQHYNSCLTLASTNNWRSFSCSDCTKYYKTTKFQPDRLSRVATPLADTFN